jgi:TolB-like protein/tetratricopeptide (TPR) repeat protein
VPRYPSTPEKVSDQSAFFAELKRRNVYKVAVAYAVVAWLLIQAASILFPTFEAPPWLMKVFVAVIVFGFPIALVLSWAFEITPEGIKRESDIAPDKSIAHHTGQKIVGITVVLGVIAAGMFALQLLGPAAHSHVMGGASDDKLRTGSATSSTDGLAGARPSIPEKSIAVLPFDNLSEEKSNEFFAEGVQDEILTRLAKVADLKVISRTSTQRFKSGSANLPEIAKQLGVMNILEGSVQKSNDQVRVNVQLINAITDAHLWADIYDRKLTDMFAVESDIAKAVADNLRAKLTGREMDEMSVRPTEDPIAHDLFVKGRYFLGLRRGDNLPRAINFFQQVIARDPNYAAAYAGLGEAYVLLPRYTAADRKETFPKARANALKAMELNPNLAEAHNVLGKLAYDADLDFVTSEREFKRAIELNPNYAGAHHWYSGGPLESSGRFDQAIAEGSRAVELDPLLAVNLSDLGRIYFSGRRFPEAKATFERAIALDPDFSYAHWHYGEMLQCSGDLNGAAVEYARARVDETHPEPIALIGQLGAKMGRPEEGRKALTILEELSKHRPVNRYWFALVHLGLGEKDEALRCLEQTYADGLAGYETGIIRVDPMLDSLRGNPRFEALVQKVTGLKEQTKP